MGKANRFSLPVLILKKLAHGFFLVAPTTTQPREGTWYVRVRLHSASFCDRGSSPGGMRRRRRLRRAERGIRYLTEGSGPESNPGLRARGAEPLRHRGRMSAHV